MEYLVGGYTMLNDIIFEDGSSIENQLGGSVFSAAGIKLWRDSVAYIGTAGPDFEEHYGPFFNANNIKTAVKYTLPRTLHYVMQYNKDGSWKEYCKYGNELEELAKVHGKITREMFEPYCDENTKGIYLEASLSTDIINNFKELKEMMPNGKLMWEIVTGDLLNPERHERLLELIKQVDIYSINFNEAKVFFQVESEVDAINAILDIKKPCFFRVGIKGAYLIKDGEVSFLGGVDTDISVDATGCGNNSTATSLIGFAEGLSPMETLAMANISAGYNARQYGPWPLADENVREEARKELKEILR